jgi:ComF family protein
MSRFLRDLIDLVYPPSCLVCDLPGAMPPPHAVCAACFTALRDDPHTTCPRCGSTVGPHADLADGCVRCRNETYRFAGVVRLGPYAGVRRDAVLRAKHSAGEPLAETLGLIFAESCRDRLLADRPHAVVPVPLHWLRRLARGYDQSVAVAHGLAAGLGLPCRPGWLRRVLNTPHQTGQSGTARRENVRGAFRARPAVRGMRVVLVDDVLTTGATCDAAAQALIAAGAAQVRVAVVAHG